MTGINGERLSKTVMVAAFGCFGLIVMFNNVTDYDSNYQFVRHVLSMDTTFPHNQLMWRAITIPVIWHLGYGMIIACEGITGMLFMLAAASMARALRSDPATFRTATRLVPWGTMVGFLVWFFGFTVVGGEWFAMWQSHLWNGQQPAFQFISMMILMCIYVRKKEDVPN
ncbi:DUF2165 domain-containing protein [Komagataeibacter intermedius]|uniref:Membrane protein n=2 Tax=Komagataeibacter intermedius TaxID=66229 RepID=A0A0N0MEZ4_9PROT|nr:DUF2165 domain-containing protein [Komagataeibacter intermedius]KPH86164.1 membrane protein [Komagataeibacter intermedius AF2]MCF3636458.1 DUF2165 domain-containing protein [Komagataeibacter intermedius]GAN85495.1 hypothetical protein Gain_0002_005 [Komagataeibacter intermedius TF2]GBQ65878.1 hypothetical protein AA0521_0571 [Komagataeibacter intermedius NRIC 0521]